MTRSSLKRNIYNLNSMNRIIVLIIACLFLFSNCNKSDETDAIPTCIQAKIETLKTAPIQNPPAEVWKWEVDGATYYYITSDCCDQYNYLYNENCVIVCAPDGGITGNGDGNCPNFTNEIIKTLVWEDNRE